MKSVRDIFRSYAQFDEQGRHVNGTDKQSNHNYGDAYENLLSIARGEPMGEEVSYCFGTRSMRPDVTLMLEIGVADGACMLAWRDIFPNATIVGMDIHPATLVREGDKRLEFHIGNQRYQSDCERVAAGRLFDLIIDDATHYIENTLASLYWLWPFVRPGGLYVVEEWPNIAGDKKRIESLWPGVQFVDTPGPFGGIEPLVAFRKPI